MPFILATMQPLDDYHYNELVQAVGIIHQAADGARYCMEDSLDNHPVDHLKEYKTILRALERLAAVIRYIRAAG